MNQHDNSETRVAKAKTTDALKAEVIPKATQEPIKATDSYMAYLRETKFKASNRKVEVETIIMSFQAELADLNKLLDAAEASESILEEKSRPQFTSIDGGQQ